MRVEVCPSCYRASCRQGADPCGTNKGERKFFIYAHIDDLRRWVLEHPRWFECFHL
jgi:hypothetical protein